MKRQCYKTFTHLIQQQIDRKLTYRFTWLATVTPPDLPEKVWAIDKGVLRRARNTGTLICNGPNTVKGEWLLQWIFAGWQKRQELAAMKITGRYIPAGAGSSEDANGQEPTIAQFRRASIILSKYLDERVHEAVVQAAKRGGVSPWAVVNECVKHEMQGRI